MKLRNKKTGAIVEAKSCNSTTGMIAIYYENNDGQLGTKDCFKTLAELYEEWEDYTPKEPLIKDEKIRKAVRAWAEVNSIKEIIIFDCYNNAPYTPVGTVEFTENAGNLKMKFRTEELFDTSRIYTIEELCGEEE